MDNKDLKNAPLEEILMEAALQENTGMVPYRVIYHFGSFVLECKDPKSEIHARYHNKLPKTAEDLDPVEYFREWGLLFYDYCCSLGNEENSTS